MSFPGKAHEAISGLLRVRPLSAGFGKLRWQYRDASLQLTLDSAVPSWPDARIVKPCCSLIIQPTTPLESTSPSVAASLEAEETTATLADIFPTQTARKNKATSRPS